MRDINKKDVYKYKLLEENKENGAESRWLNKKVHEELILFDGSSIDNIELRNSNLEHAATMKLSVNNAIHTNSLELIANTSIENITPRPSFSVKINFDNLDLSKYNRIRAKIYIESTGHNNFYFHFGFGNPETFTNHAPSLLPNMMNDVVWEVSHIKRNNIKYLTIAPFLMGTPPEGVGDIKVYIADVRAELVKSEYEHGWDTEERISYSHIGYFVNSKKIAITQNVSEKQFSLLSGETIVYSGEVEEVSSQFGTYNILDFSNFNQEGSYTLKVGNRYTNVFKISENPYLSSIYKSLNFLYALRCGENVSGIHSACHLNCRTIDDQNNSVPNFGGWHDAGDVSQFAICTAEIAHALIELSANFKDGEEDLYDRILAEAKVGISWLLRTRFKDGNRAMAVLYSIWRDNLLANDNDTVLINRAENGPFENFLAAAAEASAHLAFKDNDSAFADWSLRAAIEDFEFARIGYKQGIYTKRWGPSIDSQTSGVAAVAASILYEITNEKQYLEYGREYAKTILACQERNYIGDIKIRGFFYEDVNHQYILSYDHRGHEQSPIQGLASLMRVAKDDRDYKLWEEGLLLYKEYIELTTKYTQPFGLIPSNIYISGKVNLDHITIPATIARDEAKIDLEAQIKAGVKLGEGIYLRVFPIAIQRRGFHATLLSKTKAISIISKTLGCNNLKQIVINQLEWILGANPFSSSTMFGEGFNYHPLYVAFSPQIVGSLPVGIKTKGDKDKPYWPVINNAVYKEIWGHTTAKFLYVLSDIL